MNALVEMIDGAPRANSRLLADTFEKRHDHVLRAIDGLISQRPDLADCFAVTVDEVELANNGRKSLRYYDIDRKGFSLLAFGFTGKAALDWKIKFYDAFALMEQRLIANDRGEVRRAILDIQSPDYRDLVRVATGAAREARLLFGREAGAKVWLSMGMPDPRDLPEVHVEHKMKMWEVMAFESAKTQQALAAQRCGM